MIYDDIRHNSTIKETFVWEWMDSRFYFSHHIRDFNAIYTIWAGLDDQDKASPSLNDTDFWDRFRMYGYRAEMVYKYSGIPHNDSVWEELK